jgi:hypothetical protein
MYLREFVVQLNLLGWFFFRMCESGMAEHLNVAKILECFHFPSTARPARGSPHRYQKSRRKGRHHTYALVNVTHKLARIVWRMLTDNRPFRARPPSRARRA